MQAQSVRCDSGDSGDSVSNAPTPSAEGKRAPSPSAIPSLVHSDEGAMGGNAGPMHTSAVENDAPNMSDSSVHLNLFAKTAGAASTDDSSHGMKLYSSSSHADHPMPCSNPSSIVERRTDPGPSSDGESDEEEEQRRKRLLRPLTKTEMQQKLRWLKDPEKNEPPVLPGFPSHLKKAQSSKKCRPRAWTQVKDGVRRCGDNWEYVHNPKKTTYESIWFLNYPRTYVPHNERARKARNVKVANKGRATDSTPRCDDHHDSKGSTTSPEPNKGDSQRNQSNGLPNTNVASNGQVEGSMRIGAIPVVMKEAPTKKRRRTKEVEMNKEEMGSLPRRMTRSAAKIFGSSGDPIHAESPVEAPGNKPAQRTRPEHFDRSSREALIKHCEEYAKELTFSKGCPKGYARCQMCGIVIWPTNRCKHFKHCPVLENAQAIIEDYHRVEDYIMCVGRGGEESDSLRKKAKEVVLQKRKNGDGRIGYEHRMADLEKDEERQAAPVEKMEESKKKKRKRAWRN